MMLQPIANWQSLKLTCYSCGDTKSVKYRKVISNPDNPDESRVVTLCNRCAFFGESTINKSRYEKVSQAELAKAIAADILKIADECGGGVLFYQRMRTYAKELEKKFEGEVK